ncbi:hypothetical protein ES332_A03G214500v1 [Gossypium tomentosum]|uniref:DUF7086 domain-containing protein n=1 Tax=Gossypium tomentosum TaxID=34277 RepID=A0A5D2RAR6_GOSTO|nr:hypothetical protein ES332_A03G214500v1 [Gossypium tomentosum]
MKEHDIMRKRKSTHDHRSNSQAFDDEDDDLLRLSLSNDTRRTGARLSEEHSSIPPLSSLSVMPPQPSSPQQQAAVAAAVSLSMQTLLSQPIHPLTLSTSHILFNPGFMSPPAASFVYSQEPVLSGPDLSVPAAAPHNLINSSLVSQTLSPGSLSYPQEPVSTAVAAPVSVTSSSSPRPSRVRRNPTQNLREGKSETVEPPFPWATNYRATVYNINYLLSEKNISKITGFVQCKKCEKQYSMDFDLKEKFSEIGSFIAENKNSMHDRALLSWLNPVLPKCKYCNQENSAKPVIADKKKDINWLFLFLGQLLGCCTLEQLKYFCKHTKNHRTGAKDRVLYLTYLGLCKQLDPSGPFSR